MHDTNSNSRPSWPPILLALILFGVLCVVYGSGIHNALIFDDARLTDGTIVDEYGASAAFNWRRWLSYSSFLWLGLGETHVAQRVFNLALHVGVCVALFALFKQLLALLPSSEAADERASRCHAAALAGVAVFALNPVAVYAVGYLIQRSVVMATLFVMLASACFVRGLVTGKWHWHVPAALAALLAVLSKEHALMLPLVAVVLYVYVRRPAFKQLAVVGGLGSLALGLFAAVMWTKLGDIVGAAAFDETSGAYLSQLNALHPGFAQHAYGLSILNQAALFFAYGALWLLPNPGWLAMDLRPAFPLDWFSMPQLVGALAFVAVLLASVYALLRRRDGWSLAAVCLLSAQLLFGTEFITTWLQDPFVLYRSYLWAAWLPGLVAVALLGLGFKRNALLVFALVVGLGMAAIGFERVHSLRSAEQAWGDAAAKIDVQAPVNAVGRWRPFLNRGVALLEQGRTDDALLDFNQAVALGEPLGAAAMNQGVALQSLGQHTQAIAALERARQQGMQHPMLAYHLGASQRATGALEAAVQSLQTAAQQVTDPQVKLRVLQDLGETAMPARQLDVAEQAFAAMLQIEPGNLRGEIGQGMVQLAKQQFGPAMQTFDATLAKRDNALGHYGKALVHMAQGDVNTAQESVARARAMEPNNRNFAALAQHLKRQADAAGAK